jgi:serine protease Do
MRGEVVGINTVIVRGGSGIGFAIPSNMAKRISGELLAGGTVRRGWLGVSIQPLTPELAQSFGIKDRKGALIAEVQPDSPAAKAGLRSGDIVIRFQDKRVEDSGDLARLVGMAKPDEDARLTVLRDGAEKTLAVKLGSQPGERAAARLGLKVQPVTAEIARELSLGTAQGVVVTSVESGSAAERAGIRRGDVIREVERKPIKTVADFERATATPPADRPLTVRLERDGASLYVALPAAKSAG